MLTPFSPILLLKSLFKITSLSRYLKRLQRKKLAAETNFLCFKRAKRAQWKNRRTEAQFEPQV